jgi:CheY-like chemotaxis protein
LDKVPLDKEYRDLMAQIGLLEDNVRIAKLCATMLQYAGHQVVLYEHPRECLDALLPERETSLSSSSVSVQTKAQILPVDVLILDLHLPDMTGIEVLRFLRANTRTQELPLIFCTAATSSEIALAMRLAPRALFVEKPFSFQALVSAITHVLHAQEL